jgi:hypothetical protein
MRLSVAGPGSEVAGLDGGAPAGRGRVDVFLLDEFIETAAPADSRDPHVGAVVDAS